MTNQLNVERQIDKIRNERRKELVAAVDNLKQAVAWEEAHVEDPGGIWNTEHAVELVELAAGKLTNAVDSSPYFTHPIGWREI